MKKNRLLLLSLFVFSLLLIACKKDSHEPVYTFELVYKKDGVEEKMTPSYCKMVLKSTSPSVTEFQLVATSADSKKVFTILLNLAGDIKEGEYITGQVPATAELGADYFVNPGQPDELNFSVSDVPGKPASIFKLHITNLDNGVAMGTFSCNFMYDWITHEAITITDGRFTAKMR